MDRNDLAALLVDAPAEEVDQIHRLLHEWGIGPENSFPAQLSLLTKAQWRMAATLPRVLKDSRKLIEVHLAEYRRQTKATVDDLSATNRKQTEELKAITDKYTETLQTTVMNIKLQLVDAELAACRVKVSMEKAITEWRKIENCTTNQCERLEQVAEDLDNRFTWQQILWGAFWFSLAGGFGMLLGYYCWAR